AFASSRSPGEHSPRRQRRLDGRVDGRAEQEEHERGAKCRDAGDERRVGDDELRADGVDTLGSARTATCVEVGASRDACDPKTCEDTEADGPKSESSEDRPRSGPAFYAPVDTNGRRVCVWRRSLRCAHRFEIEPDDAVSLALGENEGPLLWLPSLD